jgi:hypothetical protein
VPASLPKEGVDLCQPLELGGGQIGVDQLAKRWDGA